MKFLLCRRYEVLMKNTKYSSWAGVTDAIQQRSRYQCALKMKNHLAWGIPSLQCSKLRRLKFPVISICSVLEKTFLW